MKNLRITELLFNRPLMISEAKLNVIEKVLGPRFNLDLSGLPSAQMAQISEQERTRAGYRVYNGVGIIGVYGPLLHRLLASEFPSGGPTTYADIRSAFDLALVDDAVQSIVLDIDSPGGEVHGAFDLADYIYQARSLKPSTAIINESAYSAGYLLASAAGRIVIPRTGGAGSIGVIATHADFSRAEDVAGITVTHVIAGARKADFSPHQPLSSEALVSLQEMVDDTYELFVDTVARNRGLKVQQVRETEAGIFEGKKAVAKKLADEVSAADKAIANTVNRRTIVSAPGQRAAAAGKEHRTMTLQELREQHPDLVAQIEAAARQGMIAQAEADTLRTEAVAGERGRVLALVAATVGQETGKRLATIAAAGLSAEQVVELGLTAAPAAAGNTTEQAMLAAITAAAPDGVRHAAGKPDAAAEERKAAASAIAAGGSTK